MTNLTMGQRIAECRKSLGLSQEALGEKMDVSRQAISKWESDGAVPEVDKLIALSKLFGTSVGWLLGVEAEKEPQSSPEISDELLFKVEEIVKRYQPAPEQGSRIVPLLLRVLGIVAVVTICIFGLKTVKDAPSDTSQRITGLESQIASLQSQISSLSQRITEAQAADTPISDYRFDITPDTEETLAHISVTVIPKSWQEGNTGTLSVRQNGTQILNQPCEWDGAGYTAQLTLPLEDGYEYWFVLEAPDGTQEQSRLTDVLAEDLADSYTLTCNVQQGTAKFNLAARTMELVNYEIYLEPPYHTVSYDIYLSSAELVLYHTRGSERQIADAYELIKPSELDDGEVISGVWCYPNGPLQLPELQDGDGLELWVKAEVSNGISTMRLVTSWAYIDGEFISGVPVEEATEF